MTTKDEEKLSGKSSPDNSNIDSKTNKGSSTADESLFSEEAITASLDELFKKGDVVELRILNAGRDKEETYYGYYNDFAKLSKDAQKYDKKAYVYVTLNPVKEEFLGKANNRLVKSKTSTPDSGILKRTHFGIDFDIRREGLSGISSNDLEHKLALGAADMVRRGLSEKFGWPEPIVADSGNGAHLVYDIDLPNDVESAELLHQCLEYLQWFYGTKHIDIDQKVFNASRIWKLYGTTACKGDPTPERPHRVSKILSIPKERKIVTSDQLIELAVQRPFEADKETEIKDQPRSDKFDIEGWMNKVGIAFKPGRSGSENGIIYDLPSCPFGGHDGSMIAQRSNGALVFKCQHSSCGDNDWKKLRALKEPARREHRDRDDEEEKEYIEPVIVSSINEIPILKGDDVPPISFEEFPEYNWIKQFVDYTCKLTATYPEYAFQNGIGLISALVRRRIKCMPFGNDTYTNLIVLNLGVSTLSNKTSAFKKMDKIINKAHLDISLPIDITPEALINAIADRSETTTISKDGERDTKTWERSESMKPGEIRPALKFMIKDEATTFYAQCRKNYMMSHKETICQLYDCPDSIPPKERVNKKWMTDEVYFGMILATTPEDFIRNMEPDDVSSGFLPRHNIVAPTWKKPLKKGKEFSDEDEDTENQLVSRQ